MTQDELKVMVAKAALEYIPQNAVLGVGSGSTVMKFIEQIGLNKVPVKEAVSSSNKTTEALTNIGVKVVDPNATEPYDVYIYGADEVDPNFNGIKGGGGALLMEKIVATPTKEYIWVVDESKVVKHLGAFKLPVEVVQYGAERLLRVFAEKGYKPAFRKQDGQRFVTDMGNFIIDLDLGRIDDPVAFASMLDTTVGVVEHGLFNGMVNKVIVAGKDGVTVLEA